MCSGVKARSPKERPERETGLFPSWAACERQIRGFSRAEHKSFHTKEVRAPVSQIIRE